MLTDQKILETITPILIERLAPFRALGVEAHGGLDHDDTPVIFARVRFPKDAPQLDPRVFLNAMAEAGHALQGMDEDRFLHLGTAYEDDAAYIDEGYSPRRRRARGNAA